MDISDRRYPELSGDGHPAAAAPDFRAGPPWTPGPSLSGAVLPWTPGRVSSGLPGREPGALDSSQGSARRAGVLLRTLSGLRGTYAALRGSVSCRGLGGNWAARWALPAIFQSFLRSSTMLTSPSEEMGTLVTAMFRRSTLGSSC